MPSHRRSGLNHLAGRLPGAYLAPAVLQISGQMWQQGDFHQAKYRMVAPFVVVAGGGDRHFGVGRNECRMQAFYQVERQEGRIARDRCQQRRRTMQQAGLQPRQGAGEIRHRIGPDLLFKASVAVQIAVGVDQ